MKAHIKDLYGLGIFINKMVDLLKYLPISQIKFLIFIMIQKRIFFLLLLKMVNLKFGNYLTVGELLLFKQTYYILNLI